ncbi:GHKL domain-containing protein [Hungatella hathewayi]|mgnify:FL=1|uniref:GHKL domain-containing protein n=1 Tax=Hungatella hathewayi TaxID=154046 RepID=UPI00033941BA|nr:GHKL domain-containing protein [Hungatella hathewayi]CCZ63541.1 putative uncharacterized protein [Hungatella hathewayi CAG:224]
MKKEISPLNRDRLVELGILIGAIRKRSGMNQEQLSEKAKVSRTTISELEAPNMVRDISLDTLFKICDVLNYVETLNGNLRESADVVNTNHAVVNVVLNQKYQCALEKNITMILSVNDLSGLTMGEEDLVTLLVNLLDNAVEACEKLEERRIIRFKMVLEDGELILSVSNPVAEPVIIDGKKIATTKKDGRNHGIGLLNVNGVIERLGGTSALRCEDGWFCFSAMIPAAE